MICKAPTHVQGIIFRLAVRHKYRFLYPIIDNNKEAVTTAAPFHPVARAHFPYDVGKEDTYVFNSDSSWKGGRLQFLSDNLLNFYESDTHRGLKMSLVPNRTIFQKDIIRTSSFPQLSAAT